jgi:hypothetical protein
MTHQPAMVRLQKALRKRRNRRPRFLDSLPNEKIIHEFHRT